MKHRAELIIDAPRALVWQLFDGPDNMQRWQPTLASFEHRSGTPGQPGAVSELVYEENGRRVVMTETITERREADFIAGRYDSAFGTTEIVNVFEALDDGRTRWQVWCNFRFRGFMMLLSLFRGGSIRRRTDADLARFKLLAETEAASA